MIGIVADKKLQTSLNFKNEGDVIYLIGENHNDINSSEYLYSFHKVKSSPAPYFNLDEEYDIHQAVKKVIELGFIESAHDCSDGGIFVNLTESSIQSSLGFDISTDKNIRKDAFLFGEAQGRVVVTVKKDDEIALVDALKATNVKFSKLGFVKGKDVKIDDEVVGSVAEFKKLYETSIEKIMNN